MPTSVGGWIAVGMFGVSVVLLLARLVLTPAFGLPLNYLIVFLPMGASGLVALFAVAAQHERSIGAFVTLATGLLMAAFLLAEALGGSGTASTLMVGEGANGKTLTISAATPVLLQLPGNPATGYDWEVSIGHPSVLEQSGMPKFTPSSSALGASGTYNFSFHAKTAGKTDLTLVYRRPWETGTAPLKTFKVTFVVQ